MLQKEMLQHIIETMNTQVNTDFILLFGSFAKGTAREDSNIDLVYFSKQKLPAYERFTLAGDLAALVGREVDVVDLKQIDTVLMMQIFSEGVPY